MRPLLAALACVALAGCATRPIAVEAPPIVTYVPPSARTCLPEPDGTKVKTDKQVAGYVADLARAGRDCRIGLATTSAILSGEK